MTALEKIIYIKGYKQHYNKNFNEIILNEKNLIRLNRLVEGVDSAICGMNIIIRNGKIYDNKKYYQVHRMRESYK